MSSASRRVILKLAYLGAGFRGFARQPGERTVEGVIIETMRKRGLLRGRPRAEVSSRTDSGVSALENVYAIDVDREFDLWEINEALPEDVVAWGLAWTDPSFSPRRACRRKVYAYVVESGIPAEMLDWAIKEVLARPPGPLCREGIPGRVKVEVRAGLLYHLVLAEGDRFCQHMIRRIVGSALNLILTGKSRVVTAPPEGLILLRTFCEGIDIREERRWLKKIEKRLSGLSRLGGVAAIMNSFISSERLPFWFPRRTT